jgi:hypothetical protein
MGGRHRAAALVCNDAWQPQLAYVATQDGAIILLIPACSAQRLFPERYDPRSYWRGITRFYGRMFQLYVVFVNCVGTDGSLRFWGGSHVVDPWGKVIAEAAEYQEHLLIVDIDLSLVRRRRREIPLVREGRLGLLRGRSTASWRRVAIFRPLMGSRSDPVSSWAAAPRNNVARFGSRGSPRRCGVPSCPVAAG